MSLPLQDLEEGVLPVRPARAAAQNPSFGWEQLPRNQPTFPPPRSTTPTSPLVAHYQRSTSWRRLWSLPTEWLHQRLQNCPSVPSLRPSIEVRNRKPINPQASTYAKIEPAVESVPRGYPRLAAFLDSDEAFSIFRRFGYVSSRLLLEKQDDMRRLEEELMRIDENDRQTYSRWLVTREEEGRRDVLIQLEAKYHEYGTCKASHKRSLQELTLFPAKLIRTVQQMMALERPATSDFESVRNFVSDRKPVVSSESNWIYRKSDVVTLRPHRDQAWLRRGIKRTVRALHCRLIEVNVPNTPERKFRLT